MKIRLNENEEIVKTIREGLKAKGGYCPCKMGKSEDIKCLCEEFKAQVADPDFDRFCDQVVALMEEAEEKMQAL